MLLIFHKNQQTISKALALLLGALVMLSLSLYATPSVRGVAGSDPRIGPGPPLYFYNPSYPGYPTWTTVNLKPALQLTPVAIGAMAGAAWHALSYAGQPVEVSMNGTYTRVGGQGLADGFKIIMFAQDGTGSLRYQNNTNTALAGCFFPSSTGIMGSAGATPNSTKPYFSLNWDPFYKSGGQFNLWVVNQYCSLVANPGGIGCSIGQPAAFDTIRFNTTYTPSGNTLQARVSDLTSGADCSFSVSLTAYGFSNPNFGNYWAMILGANGGGEADWTLFQVAIRPSTATVVFDASTNAPWSDTEVSGASAYDTANVTGISSKTPSGTVTYAFYTNGGCTGTPSTTQTVTLTASGSVPNSMSHGPLATGMYSFNATYSGDSNNTGSQSPCAPFGVGVSKTATVVFDASTKAAWSGTETVGASAFDTANVTTFGTIVATGTVSYTFYSNGVCSGAGSPAGKVKLSHSGAVPNSNTEGPLAAGSFSFRAFYSGDINYLSSTGPCEPFIVNPSFDFSISNSGGITVVQGSSGSNTISVALASGTSQSVSLTCSSGLPTLASCSFNPSSGIPIFSSTLTVSTSTSTPAGSFTITVAGTGGGTIHTTQFTLTVNPLTVGGTIVPINKLALLAPYVGLVAAILTGTIATIIYVVRTRRIRETANSTERS